MRPKQIRSLAIVVAAVSILASTRPAAAQNVPPDPLSVRMPDDAVGADVELIVSIAGRLGVPFGFEAAGALNEGVSMPFSTRGGSSRPKPLVSVRPTPLDVRGVTLRQALDAVVAKDRRYEWRDVDGVVVVRPRAAWHDPEHPLLRRVPAAGVRPDPEGDELLAALRHPSLDFTGGTLFELLNAAVRASGRRQWSLRSDVNTILLDRGRAVTVSQPVLSVGTGGDSRTYPLAPTPPPEPRRP
jgi:hypothetical protein